ncbi:unnamed protein product [marine sediment metagenome]|uniref:ROK family protein n=1 Tax=marine sediment metagenome TaxID=412755 RepID=X1PI84_9ZZZZ
MSAAPDYIVGVDLGGTNIVSLLMTGKGEIVGRDTRPALAKEGKDKVLSQKVYFSLITVASYTAVKIIRTSCNIGKTMRD